jgi:hypothetical protein
MIGVRVLSLGALLGLSTFPVEAVQATQPQSAKFTFPFKCSGARHFLTLLLQQQNLAHMAMNATHNLQYLPWTWSVKSSDPNAHCPQASSILGTFAIINVLVSLIGLVFGNRVVTNKISCGIFGKLGSSAYQYMWILTVVLQFSSNILVASIIKHTPGYGDDFSISQLMLFFIARPRLSWIFLTVVASRQRKLKEMKNSDGTSLNELEPFKYPKRYIQPNERDISPTLLSDSEPQRYTHGQGYSHVSSTDKADATNLPVADRTERPWSSSFLSQLIAEIILQLINLSTTGRLAFFATKHGYYILSNSQYHRLPRGAHLMYAGALLYTITLPPFLFLNLFFWLLMRRRRQEMEPGEEKQISQTTIGVMQSLVVVLAVSTWLSSWLIWSGYVLLMGDL